MNLRTHISALILGFIGRLPLPLARTLGAGLGQLAYLVQDRNSRTTRLNIQACFPELDPKQAEALTKQSMIETGKLAFEMNIIWRNSIQKLLPHIKTIHNEHLIKEAVATQKGVIVLCPHIGNWEVIGKHIPSYGPITSLYQPPKQPSIEQFIKRSREMSGARLVPTSTRGISALLKRIKKGEMTGILPDQVPDQGGGEFAPFFGLPAYTMTLVHGLVRRTDCRVLLGFSLRVENGFDIHYYEPPNDIYSSDSPTALKALNETVEMAVKKAPTQYQWEYKRFRKKLPDGTRAIMYK